MSRTNPTFWLFACLAVALAAPASAQVAAPPSLAIDYFERLDAVYRAGSTPDDIARLFELMADDVRYRHHEYGADFDRADWQAAFARLHGEGRYSARVHACTAITNFIPGKSHHAIEYAEGIAADGICNPAEGERKLVLFEVRDDKIRRVEELW